MNYSKCNGTWKGSIRKTFTLTTSTVSARTLPTFALTLETNVIKMFYRRHENFKRQMYKTVGAEKISSREEKDEVEKFWNWLIIRSLQTSDIMTIILRKPTLLMFKNIWRGSSNIRKSLPTWNWKKLKFLFFMAI